MIDTQLVDRYVMRSDPTAFRDLVTRHGPAVLRACRGVLHDPHEAEDAFQATFLILVRRAPSIRDPERLDRWLVGVARRVATRSRRRAAVRAERDRRWAAMHPEGTEPDRPLFDLRRVVREELELLPEEYRRPLTLCYLEGLTHEEAAARLGWPVGTVKVRLVRARRRLRDRLDRRGVALGVALLLLLLRRDALGSAAAIPAASTVDAMTLAASGEFAALEARYPRAAALARSAWGRGLAAPGWRALLVALAFFVASTGGIALAHQAHRAREAASSASAALARALEAGCR